MSGWIWVIVIILLEIALAVYLASVAVRRWWDAVLMTALTAALIGPTARHVTGDVSRYLPQVIWSDGGEGKDQIICIGAASTILLPLIAVAGFACLLRLVRQA